MREDTTQDVAKLMYIFLAADVQAVCEVASDRSMGNVTEIRNVDA